MNKLDSELLKGELSRRGFELVGDSKSADIVLYNTCSVRAHAEEKAFSHIGCHRRRARRDKNFIVGVFGCAAQRLGEEIAKRFDYVKLVCGTSQFLNVPHYLQQILEGGGPVIALEQSPLPEFDRLPQAREHRHSAYISIMRGCNRFCAYCIVPHVRGREVSRRPEEILDEVRRLSEDGVREVTLLGQNVNSYGKGMGDPGASLECLLRKAETVPGIERIRFVTNHPADMTEEILKAVADCGKVCEHLHMPAQSGSNAVLRRMNRGYAVEHYREMIDRARQIIPGVEIASDFLVGFPGETESDFQQSLQLVKEVEFQQSFIFKYSERPGTSASRLKDDVPEETKRERNALLLSAQQQVDRKRRAALVGSSLEVLVDGASKTDSSRLSGRTRQNDIVVLEGPESLSGQLCSVRITGSTPLTLFGDVL